MATEEANIPVCLKKGEGEESAIFTSESYEEKATQLPGNKVKQLETSSQVAETVNTALETGKPADESGSFFQTLSVPMVIADEQSKTPESKSVEAQEEASEQYEDGSKDIEKQKSEESVKKLEQDEEADEIRSGIEMEETAKHEEKDGEEKSSAKVENESSSMELNDKAVTTLNRYENEEKVIVLQKDQDKAEFGGLEISDSVAPSQQESSIVLEKDQGNTDGVTNSQEAPCVDVKETSTVQNVSSVIDFKEQDPDEKLEKFVEVETGEKSVDAQEAAEEREDGAKEETVQKPEESVKKIDKEEETDVGISTETKSQVEKAGPEEEDTLIDDGQKEKPDKEVCEKAGSEKAEYEKEETDSTTAVVNKYEEVQDVNMLEKDENQDDVTSVQDVPFGKDLQEKNQYNADEEHEVDKAEESIEELADVCVSTTQTPFVKESIKNEEMNDEKVIEKEVCEENVPEKETLSMLKDQEDDDSVTSSQEAPFVDAKETTTDQHASSVADFKERDLNEKSREFLQEEIKEKSLDAQEENKECEDGIEEKPEESVKEIEKEEETDVGISSETKSLLEKIGHEEDDTQKEKPENEVYEETGPVKVEYEKEVKPSAIAVVNTYGEEAGEKGQDVNALEKDEVTDEVTSARDVSFEKDLQEKNHYDEDEEQTVGESKENIEQHTDVCVSTQTTPIKESIKNEEMNDEKVIEKEVCEENDVQVKAESEGVLEISDSVAPSQKETVDVLKDLGDNDGVTSSQEAPCVDVKETTNVQHGSTVSDFKEKDLKEEPREFLHEETEEKSLDSQEASKECDDGEKKEIEQKPEESVQKIEKEEETDVSISTETKTQVEKTELEEEDTQIYDGHNENPDKEVCEETGSEKVEYEKEVEHSALEAINKDETEDEEKEKDANVLEKDDDITSSREVTLEKDVQENNHHAEEDENEVVTSEETIEKGTEDIISSEETERQTPINSIPTDVFISTQTEPEEETTEKKDEEAIEIDDGQTKKPIIPMEIHEENVPEIIESEDVPPIAHGDHEKVHELYMSEKGKSEGDDVSSSENASNMDIQDTTVGQHVTTTACLEEESLSAVPKEILTEEAKDKSVEVQEETQQHDDGAIGKREEKAEEDVNETAHTCSKHEEEYAEEIKLSVETTVEKDVSEIISQEEAAKNEESAIESDGIRKEKPDEPFVEEVCEESDLKKTESEEERQLSDSSNVKSNENIEETKSNDMEQQGLLHGITTDVCSSTKTENIEKTTECKEKNDDEKPEFKEGAKHSDRLSSTLNESETPDKEEKLEKEHDPETLEVQGGGDEVQEIIPVSQHAEEIIIEEADDKSTDVKEVAEQLEDGEKESEESVNKPINSCSVISDGNTGEDEVDIGNKEAKLDDENQVGRTQNKTEITDESISTEKMSLELGQLHEQKVEETNPYPSETVSENPEPEDEIKKEDKDFSHESVNDTNEHVTKEEKSTVEHEPIEVHGGLEEVSEEKVTDLTETPEVEPQEDIKPSGSLETSTKDPSSSEKEKAETVSEVQIPELVPEFEDSMLKKEFAISEMETHLDEEKEIAVKEISSDVITKETTECKEEVAKVACEETSSEKNELEEGLELFDNSDMKINDKEITTFKDENEENEENEVLQEKNYDNEGNEDNFIKSRGVDEDTPEIKSNIETKENTEEVTATNVSSSTYIEPNKETVEYKEKNDQNDENEIVNKEENSEDKQEDATETKMVEPATTVTKEEEGDESVVTQEARELHKDEANIKSEQSPEEDVEETVKSFSKVEQEEEVNEEEQQGVMHADSTTVQIESQEENEEKDIESGSDQKEKHESSSSDLNEKVCEETELIKNESEEDIKLSDNSGVILNEKAITIPNNDEDQEKKTGESAKEDHEVRETSVETKEIIEQHGVTNDVLLSAQTEAQEEITEIEKQNEDSRECDDGHAEKPDTPSIKEVCEETSSEKDGTIPIEEKNEEATENGDGRMNVENQEKEHEVKIAEIQGDGDDVESSPNTSNEETSETKIDQHATTMVQFEDKEITGEVEDKSIYAQEASEQCDNVAKDKVEQQPEESVDEPVNSCSETIERSVEEEADVGNNKELESKVEAENQADKIEDVSMDFVQPKELNFEEIQACLTETISGTTEDKITKKDEDLSHEGIEHIEENITKEEKSYPDGMTKENAILTLEDEPVEEQSDGKDEVSKEEVVLNETTIKPQEDIAPSNEKLPIEDLESVSGVHIPDVLPRSEDLNMKEDCVLSATEAYADKENITVTKEISSEENLETRGSAQQPENSFSTAEENIAQLEQVGEINSLGENRDIKEDVTQENQLNSTEDDKEIVKAVVLTEDVPLEIEEENGINDLKEQTVEEDNYSPELEKNSAQNQKEMVQEVQIEQEDLQDKEDINSMLKVAEDRGDQEPKDERISSLEDAVTIESGVDLSNTESTVYPLESEKLTAQTPESDCDVQVPEVVVDSEDSKVKKTKTTESSSASDKEHEYVEKASTESDEAKSSDLILEEKSLTKENIEVHEERELISEQVIEDQLNSETKPQSEQSDITSRNIIDESKLEHTGIIDLQDQNETKNIEKQKETTKNIILSDEVVVETEEGKEKVSEEDNCPTEPDNISAPNQKMEYLMPVGNTEVTEVKAEDPAELENIHPAEISKVEDDSIDEPSKDRILPVLEDSKASELQVNSPETSKDKGSVLSQLTDREILKENDGELISEVQTPEATFKMEVKEPKLEAINNTYEKKLVSTVPPEELTSLTDEDKTNEAVLETDKTIAEQSSQCNTDEVLQIKRSNSRSDDPLETKNLVEDAEEPKLMADNLNVKDETITVMKEADEESEIVASESKKVENVVTKENIIKVDADKEKVTADEPQAESLIPETANLEAIKASAQPQSSNTVLIDQKEKSESAVLHEPAKGNSEVVGNLIGERDLVLAEETGESGVKTDEEDEEEDNEDDEKMGSDAPVMVEASKDIEVKAQKKSHNILSGVGSKVKHSIAKVKKAITGKSSPPKSPSAKEKNQVIG